MSPSARALASKVEEVRDYLVRRTGIVFILWIVVGGLLLYATAWLFVGSEGWRAGSNVPATIDAIAIGGAIVAFLAFRRGVERWFAEPRVAATIETASDLAPGLLRGSLELAQAEPTGASSALVRRGADRVAASLGDQATPALAGPLAEAVDRRMRVARNAMVAALLGCVGMTVASPERSAHAIRGLASPVRTAADPVLPPLVVQPGSVEVQRGTDLALAISAGGRSYVRVVWQAAGDVVRSDSLEVEEGAAQYVFRSIAAGIDYRVVDDVGNESESYTITPVDPLFVSDLTVHVVYPSHTGLPADEFRGDPPALRLPVGSTVSFEGRASRPLAAVSLQDSTGSTALSFEIDGADFSGRWVPRRDALLEWDFSDVSGAPAEIQPEPIEVNVIPDAAPLVAISVPGRDTVMPLNLRQSLVVEAGDDYGLRRLELVAYRVTSFGERMEPVSQGFEIGGQRAIVARPLLDLSRWGLLPGDTVRYFARAVDNSPGGQVSVSPEYVLRLPEAAEMRREAEDALESVAERLEELAEDARAQAEENRDQALEALNQPQEGGPDDQAFENREEMEAALEEQRQMSAEVDSLAGEMAALERMMEEAAQADPELRRQLEELQDLLDQAAGDDLQQRMDELAEALEQGEMQEANQSLEEMAAEQEEFRQRLEEALEQFERAALEQDFRATTSEAEELARQEQALADALQEGDQPELRAQQQEDLARQTDRLAEQMEELEERLAESGEAEAAQGVEEARRNAQEALQQMREAQESAEQGSSEQAGQEAQEAAEAMQEAAEQMSQAMQEMAQQEMEQQQEALMRTADDALSLARRQDELREQMRGASPDQMAGMRADQASLLRGVQNVAENLQLATEGAADANRELSAQMGLAMESLQETIEAMQSRRGATSPAAQAEQAIGDLNQLALMAIASAEQMGQQGQGQSGEDVSEQLEQLAQEQGELMNQSSQLMPMQLGEQAMSQQLQEMQQGQQSVASDLGDLADEPGSEESLGDLQQLAVEAQELAAQMAEGRLTPEMVQRQERLFHRLLDAGRSLEREEFSEERESEEPGPFDRVDPSALTADQLGVLQFEIRDGTRLQELSPAVRQLVLEYFDRLNRSRRQPGGGGP